MLVYMLAIGKCLSKAFPVVANNALVGNIQTFQFCFERQSSVQISFTPYERDYFSTLSFVSIL